MLWELSLTGNMILGRWEQLLHESSVGLSCILKNKINKPLQHLNIKDLSERKINHIRSQKWSCTQCCLLPPYSWPQGGNCKRILNGKAENFSFHNCVILTTSQLLCDTIPKMTCKKMLNSDTNNKIQMNFMWMLIWVSSWLYSRQEFTGTKLKQQSYCYEPPFSHHWENNVLQYVQWLKQL